MLSITSPARDIYHLSFDIFHLPLIWLYDARQGFKNDQWQISNEKWEMIWLRVDSNHQPRAYETLALFRLSYTAVDLWKPAEELNLVPFRPALQGSV